MTGKNATLTDLTLRGRTCWRETVGRFELTPAETKILTGTCRYRRPGAECTAGPPERGMGHPGYLHRLVHHVSGPTAPVHSNGRSERFPSLHGRRQPLAAMDGLSAAPGEYEFTDWPWLAELGITRPRRRLIIGQAR